MTAAPPPPSDPAPPPPPSRVLCLGEALVDLICDRPIDDLAEAERFVPRFGGVVANVAVVAARTGARVALAGGAGDDSWGEWLHDRLEDEGVDLSLFRLVGGAQTQIAITYIGNDAEPRYEVYAHSSSAPTRWSRPESGMSRCVPASWPWNSAGP
jgi:sugar/nucleoside kinase (ribokinase family)